MRPEQSGTSYPGYRRLRCLFPYLCRAGNWCNSPAHSVQHRHRQTRRRTFFCGISGFILGIPFASFYLLNAPKISLKQYFLRRLIRLEPPYFLSLIAWGTMQRVVALRSLRDIAPHLAAGSFYLHHLIFGGFPGVVNSVAWSLEVPVFSFLFAIADARLRRAVILVQILVAGFLSNPLIAARIFTYSIRMSST